MGCLLLLTSARLGGCAVPDVNPVTPLIQYQQCNSGQPQSTCARLFVLLVLSQLTGLVSKGFRYPGHFCCSCCYCCHTGVSCLPFQTLSKLTYLHIGVDVCDSTCSHLSCLASLQQLHISKYAAISSNRLALCSS